MRRSLLLVIVALVLGLVVVGAPPAGLAGEKVTLKIAHVVDTKHPYQIGAEVFAKRLQELSGGRIEGQVYPSSQLGNERELVEAIQFGTVESAGVTSAVISRFVKELEIFNLPFLFRDFDHVYKVLDGPFGEELNQAAIKKGIRIVGFWVGGTRSVYARKPIGDLASLKGIKVRTIETPIVLATWKALGTIPTPIPFSEVYTALQQGVVDAGEGNVISYNGMKFDEVAPYLSHIKYLITITPLILGEKFLQAQPPELQKAILQAGQDSVAAERTANEQDEAKIVDILKAKGRTVVIPEVAPFQKAVEPVYDQYGKTIGVEKIRWIQSVK